MLHLMLATVDAVTLMAPSDSVFPVPGGSFNHTRDFSDTKRLTLHPSKFPIASHTTPTPKLKSAGLDQRP